jgi:hypothetical protein
MGTTVPPVTVIIVPIGIKPPGKPRRLKGNDGSSESIDPK